MELTLRSRKVVNSLITTVDISKNMFIYFYLKNKHLKIEKENVMLRLVDYQNSLNTNIQFFMWSSNGQDLLFCDESGTIFMLNTEIGIPYAEPYQYISENPVQRMLFVNDSSVFNKQNISQNNMFPFQISNTIQELEVIQNDLYSRIRIEFSNNSASHIPPSPIILCLIDTKNSMNVSIYPYFQITTISLPSLSPLFSTDSHIIDARVSNKTLFCCLESNKQYYLLTMNLRILYKYIHHFMTLACIHQLVTGYFHLIETQIHTISKQWETPYKKYMSFMQSVNDALQEHNSTLTVLDLFRSLYRTGIININMVTHISNHFKDYSLLRLKEEYQQFTNDTISKLKLIIHSIVQLIQLYKQILTYIHRYEYVFNELNVTSQEISLFLSSLFSFQEYISQFESILINSRETMVTFISWLYSFYQISENDSFSVDSLNIEYLEDLFNQKNGQDLYFQHLNTYFGAESENPNSLQNKYQFISSHSHDYLIPISSSLQSSISLTNTVSLQGTQLHLLYIYIYDSILYTYNILLIYAYNIY
ncbi:hypothetical protein WA158_005405 [Blastocystis sp. Blastoise]